ncbi:MAG: glucuronate isomerase [Clostridiales bacterium]|jgi:glucuronate isomerase|nr:glucuronate isomerase [Clostridiales bacterium]
MEFLSDELLLNSGLAVQLYRDYARDLPIIDYHSHLSPQEIAEDRPFFNLTELWLKGDHYKWRLMRNCGVPEELVTGKASDRDKFRAFAAVLPAAIGNPIYIWCHLELKTYFGLTLELDERTADEVYDRTAARMKDGSFSAKRLIARSNVSALCTTDDPMDDLAFHKKIAASGFETGVYPTFRPDRALRIDRAGFAAYVQALTGKKRPSLTEILAALSRRLDYFCENGCFISDHALDNYTFMDCPASEAEEIVGDALAGRHPTDGDAEKYQTYVLSFLAGEYSRRGMAMQLHLCCRRDNNGAKYAALGPDTGFDAIAQSKDSHKLAAFLDALDRTDALPKTIVYSLDPNDDRLINSVLNAFQSPGTRGKLQHGSAWWFNDTRFGMAAHLRTLSEYSVLGNFIGMLTDSRSFTSYVRHDYFRRILCSHIAQTVNDGEYPANQETLSRLIKNICCDNAKNYFQL